MIPTAQSPGKLLREARKRNGISQKRLAARAGTTQSAISRIEHDRVSPSFSTLEALLRVLGEELTLASRPVDHGHDLAMIGDNVGREPAERLERGLAHARFVQRNRGAARTA